jgi:hypothetical protein
MRRMCTLLYTGNNKEKFRLKLAHFSSRTVPFFLLWERIFPRLFLSVYGTHLFAENIR